MIFGLFRRPSGPATLYGAIVAQSRQPLFYRAFGVPDTVEGRFDMIILHLALLTRRLGRDGEAGRGLAQDVFDLFCRDMDGNLREMWVGDLAVPKRMRGFAEAFYGRRAAYEAALADGDEETLAAALARNVCGRAADAGARALATYVHAAVHALDAHTGEDFAGGTLAFPAPRDEG
jgi:cytochrome b pre-mRNA-processing protein 3